MKTVLVIDDEFGVADVLSFALEEEGYKTLTAANGRDGLKKAAELKPDLIVLDFMMPILDGPATLKAIRNNPDLSQIPVIMISSIDEDGVKKHCPNYSAFLRKPFSMSDFIKMVSACLATRSEDG